MLGKANLMTTAQTVRPVRGRGRPRSTQGQAAILEAAGRLLEDRGVARTSMEAIAADAGVGKATIYRWWSSKEQLMVDAVGHLRGYLAPPPHTDDPRADLLQTVRDGLDRFAGTPGGDKLFPRLLDAAVDSPRLAEAWRERLIAPRRAAIADILRRAIQAGQLPAQLDLELAVDLLVAPLIYRLHVTGADTPPTVADRLVAMVWDGLASDRGQR